MTLLSCSYTKLIRFIIKLHEFTESYIQEVVVTFIKKKLQYNIIFLRVIL